MTLKIELKNIKHAEFASEETHCYSATLYVDGVKWGEVSNDGHGGADMFHGVTGKNWGDYSDLDKRVAAEFPPTDLTDIGMPGKTSPASLEVICADIVNAFLRERRLKNLLKRSIVFFDKDPKQGAPLYTVPLKGRAVPALAEAVAKKYPGAVILNTEAPEKALALFSLAA